MDTYQPLLQKLKARVEVRTLLLLICVVRLFVRVVSPQPHERTYTGSLLNYYAY
jgi:hypothetical protein